MVTEAEARRIRPLMSGLVALAVALVTAIGWYYVGRPDESPQKIEAFDWQPQVRAGRADGKLQVAAPAELPGGWIARNAVYTTGVAPRWQLAMLTAKGDAGKFVEVLEGRETVADLIDSGTDGEVTQGKRVLIDGAPWQSWQAGRDYVLSRTLTGPDGNAENVIVHGSAPDAVIRDFTATLVLPKG
jgi:hypothetical protein